MASSSDSSLPSVPPTSLDGNSSGLQNQQGEDIHQSCDVLLYERVKTACLAALLLCFVILLLFSCYKWRVKQRRNAQKQKQQRGGWQHQRDQDSRRPMLTVPIPTSSSQAQRAQDRSVHQPTTDYGPFPYKINPIYVEHDEVRDGALVDTRTPSKTHAVSVHESSPFSAPPSQPRDDSKMTNGREGQRSLLDRRADGENDSETERARLMEMVAESMRRDPDLEASMRDLAGSEWKDADIVTLLDQLTTNSLRVAYDEIQRLKHRPLGLFEESD